MSSGGFEVHVRVDVHGRQSSEHLSVGHAWTVEDADMAHAFRVLAEFSERSAELQKRAEAGS